MVQIVHRSIQAEEEYLANVADAEPEFPQLAYQSSARRQLTAYRVPRRGTESSENRTSSAMNYHHPKSSSETNRVTLR